MKVKPIRAYVGFMGVAAAVVVVSVPWLALAALPKASAIGLGALIALALLSERLALTIRVAQTSGGSSITFIPLLGSVVLFGPVAALLLMLITGGVTEFFLRRKPPIRAAFNVSQFILSTGLAGWAYVAVGGFALAGPGAPVPVQFDPQLGAFVAFGAVFVVINHAAVSLAIALDQDFPFKRVLAALIGRAGTNIFYDLLISPIAIVLAVLYVELWIGGFLVILLPLLFIRHSYLTVFKLQQANRDLLKALVKAIETRDPYTSGHSLRVSDLAGRIAEALRVPTRKVESIKTAALLHDIGKIEAIYADILRKPGSLSDEERTIIESHVTKGVELLTSMGSFDADVILAVKHHHEWINGNGYPDGLAGREIPLGARIVKICDAIDAMLSDRPYRQALSLPQVCEQLEVYAGTQFDGEIVQTVVSNGLLKDYASEMRMVRSLEEVSDPRRPLESSLGARMS